MEGVLGFMLAGFALAGSPGPATLSLAATGAAFGARRALGYLAGIVIGMIVVMAIIATGLAGLMLALPGATAVAATMAAAYLVYLAYRIATAPPLAETTDRVRRPAFVDGLFLSLVNPKGYAAMTALFSGFVLAGERPYLDAAVKIAILATIIVVVDVAWLFVGVTITRAIRDPGINRAINVSFAVLLLASVGFALLF